MRETLRQSLCILLAKQQTVRPAVQRDAHAPIDDIDEGTVKDRVRVITSAG